MSDKVMIVEGTATINLKGKAKVYRKVGDSEPFYSIDLADGGEIISEIDEVNVLRYKSATFSITLPLNIELPEDKE